VPVIESPGGDIQWIPMNECIDGDVYVLEKSRGIIKLKDLILKKRVDGLIIWDGERFVDAYGYQTEKKSVRKLVSKDGTEIISSPDHKFRVLENGELIWKERRDLSLDDILVLNKKSLENKNCDRYSFKGTVLDEDIWEVLGWMTGDGSWKKDRKSCSFHLYYNYEKEQNIRDRHFKILEKYGLNPIKTDEERSDEEIEKIKKSSGFKSVSRYSIQLNFNSKDFYCFLKELGFKDSSEGKNVPCSLVTQDLSIIYSYLKGLFSADGSCSTKGQVILCCSNDELRQQVKFLLAVLGIKSMEGKNTGLKFGKIRDSKLIRVSDSKTFCEKIGFLQEHKTENSHLCTDGSDWIFVYKKNIFPIMEQIKDKIESSDLLDHEIHAFKNLFYDVKSKGKGVRLRTLFRYAEATKVKLPDFFELYNFEGIKLLEESDEKRCMYDIESLEAKHQFIASNHLVHNTNVDMMFHDWLEFLIVMACCIFKIDPSECGWNFGKLANSLPFGQDGQKQRLKHSQSKGLVPVMRLIQRVITKWWVNRIDSDYEFVFTGVEQEDQIAALDMDVKKAGAGFMSMEDGFQKWSARPFNPEKDTILNPAYQQAQMQKMTMEQSMMGMSEGSPGSAGIEGGPDEGVNPFEKALLNYVDNKFS
jgi:hypothetical protein